MQLCGRNTIGCLEGKVLAYVENWLKDSRVIMLTFVNTFLSFVF